MVGKALVTLRARESVCTLVALDPHSSQGTRLLKIITKPKKSIDIYLRKGRKEEIRREMSKE